MDLVTLLQSSANIQSFSDGDTIFQQGDAGEISYILVKGQVDIQVNRQSIYVATPGEMLGIMALIDEKPRSATAIALGDSQLVPLSKKDFLFLVQETPYFALDIMKMLCEWLRLMDAKVKNKSS
ncbi:MAG: cyclic nucleotide-binding domain-containing protein [Cyanobacteria bacterium J06597_1]